MITTEKANWGPICIITFPLTRPISRILGGATFNDTDKHVVGVKGVQHRKKESIKNVLTVVTRGEPTQTTKLIRFSPFWREII